MKLNKLIILLSLVTLISGCVTLAVTGGAALAMSLNDRRTIGTQLDDQNLESKAYQMYTAVPGAENQASLSFTAFNGILLVTGQSQSKSILDQVIVKLKTLPKIRIIHNEVKMVSSSSALTTVSDTALTTSVKTKLTFAENVNSNHVKVVSENGEVFLMGMVTKDEAALIIDVVRRVSGVQKVIELFEFI